MVASIVPEDTPSTSGVESKHFSEINQVEDQNNGNGVYSTLKVQMSKIHPH